MQQGKKQGPKRPQGQQRQQRKTLELQLFLLSLPSLGSLFSYAPTLNSTPCASGSSVPQLRVQVWRRM
jgi:hypothetical protein